MHHFEKFVFSNTFTEQVKQSLKLFYDQFWQKIETQLHEFHE